MSGKTKPINDGLDNYVSSGLAIIGPYNTIWTDRVFESPEEAYKYIADFWGKGKWKPEDWRLVHAQQIVEVFPIKYNKPFPLVSK